MTKRLPSKIRALNTVDFVGSVGGDLFQYHPQHSAPRIRYSAQLLDGQKVLSLTTSEFARCNVDLSLFGHVPVRVGSNAYSRTIVDALYSISVCVGDG